MSGTVVVHLEAAKGLGNLTHDLDNERRPGHVDKTKSHLNTIVLGQDFKASKNLVKQQAKNIVEDFNAEKNRQRELINKNLLSDKEYLSQRRRIRNWQSHMKTHLAGVISFGQDAQANGLDRRQMDECAQSYIRNLCSRHHIELAYLVRHEDETTVHYHFFTTNYDGQAKQTIQLDREALRKEQDAIGDSFSTMGLTRGIDKQKRLKQTAQKLNHPPIDGRYSPEVWKQSNVIHRSVKQLHEDLPLEIYAKQEELAFLESSLDAQKARLAKNLDLIEKNEQRLTVLSMEHHDYETQSKKLQSRIDTYQKRVVDAQAEIDRLSLKFSPPKKTAIEHVTGYTKKRFGKVEPIIKKVAVVTPKNALENFRIAAAKEKKLEQEEARLRQWHQKQNEKRLQEEEELQAFFDKQAFKHLLVFGKPIESNDEMFDFIRWFDQKTDWTTTNFGTRFKVQRQDGGVVRVVVEHSPTISAEKIAQTLLYAARESGMRSGRYTGSVDVFIELWKQNKLHAVPFELRLTAEQERILIKENLFPGEPHASVQTPLTRLPT